MLASGGLHLAGGSSGLGRYHFTPTGLAPLILAAPGNGKPPTLGFPGPG